MQYFTHTLQGCVIGEEQSYMPVKYWGNCLSVKAPDSKVYGANMGPIWGRQDPGGTHVGPIKFDIWAS